MKRAAISTLILVGMFSLGIWTGRSSTAILPRQTQLSDEMNQALKFQALKLREAEIRRELIREIYRRLTQDPPRRYGVQNSVAGM